MGEGGGAEKKEEGKRKAIYQVRKRIKEGKVPEDDREGEDE